MKARNPVFSNVDNHPAVTNLGSEVRRIVVIGAGVAGLQAARHLLTAGFHVVILEAADDVGGVWRGNYQGYGLQVPKDMYQFPDFPYPPELLPKEDYPTGQEVQAYIKAYVAHFGLAKYIKLGCKLLQLRSHGVSSTGEEGWDVLFQDLKKENKFFEFHVDFAVVSNGLYSHPFMPQYEGSNIFRGLQLHAKDFKDASITKDRHVLMIGAGKTGLDCAAEVAATRSAISTTLLFRQSHWPIPRQVLGIPIRNLMFNRMITKTLPPYYTASACRKKACMIASTLTKPLKRAVWAIMESTIKSSFNLTGDHIPSMKLPKDLFYGGQILDISQIQTLKEDHINLLKGEIACFTRDGVILQNGQFLMVDVVVYCTGYKKSYDYLCGEPLAKLQIREDGLYLYRNMIPPGLSNLCFLGGEVSTYNNILTHGLQALWLVKLLQKELQLPQKSEMEADIREQQRWKRSLMPNQRQRGSTLMLYMHSYHDQLLRDMNLSPRRKGFFLKEAFSPYSAADYRSLFEMRHA